MTTRKENEPSWLERALALALEAHRGAVDKQGQPYILHPLRVMFGVEGETARVVAVLHDVVEDTQVTLADVRAHGFPTEVIEALALVTHRHDEPYADYVVACAANQHARQVKLADLRDNASLARALVRPNQLARDARRLQKYFLSHQFLMDEISESSYRQAMQGLE